MTEKEDLRAKRETLVVVAFLLLSSLFIIYPFLDAILIAVAVSYLLDYVHKKLNPYIENEFLSSLIIISSVFAVISLSIYFFVDNFFNILAQFNLFTGSLQDQIIAALEPLNLPQSFIESLKSYFQTISDSLSDVLIDIFVSVPSLLVDVGIFFVASVFLYRDRSRISSKTEEVLESLPDTEEKIIRSLIESIDKIFQGVFMTQFAVAAVLGAVAAVGFYLIGLATTPIDLLPLWIFLIALASLLPLLANIIFYIPLGLYYMVPGGEPIKGILIIVYGVIFLQIMPEVVLRPWVGSKSLDEHPLIIFLGFLAGPIVLGVKGLILGPLILILTKEFAFNYADLVSDPSPGSHSEDTEE
ncbi:MAG: AI-2E family transporter [Candidatus Nanohalobium sp.]